jgi:enediyne biosynthesis protein E4
MKALFLFTCIILFLLSLSMLQADPVDADDLQFLLEREQYHLIDKYQEDFYLFASSDDITERKLLLDFAQRTQKLDLAADIHYSIARDFGSVEDGLQWLILQATTENDSILLQQKTSILRYSFDTSADSLVFAHYACPELDLLAEIQALPQYNDIIEAQAKAILDEISGQSSSHEAIELIEDFYASYPSSKWHQAAFYLHLSHLAKLKDYTQLQKLIFEHQSRSAAHAYIAALFGMSPSVRREQSLQDEVSSNQILLSLAQNALIAADADTTATVLYDDYPAGNWQSRVQLQKAKALYYYDLSVYDSADIIPGSLFGDEPDLIGLYKKPGSQHKALLRLIDKVHFAANDRGELAEYYYWRGKINALFSSRKYLRQAAKDFGQCLIYGAPRNRYDAEAVAMIAKILQKLDIRKSPIEYLREIFDYNGIIFEDTHSFSDKRYTRVALADYDNDGLIDLLFNGRYLYRNLGAFDFSAHPDTSMISRLHSNGGLWADFNKDGYLDFVSISHAADGMGDALMKQNPDHSFVRVNARAGDIDDQMPTEGAAFIDIDGSGFPSLYMANYEAWQQQSGYPDYFWHNDAGFFSERSSELGFWTPEYTTAPGLAGRGVAPADFNNDGAQEILVTNYRLNRNFLFSQSDTLFWDVAALYGVAGHHKSGYYGHSIGADWADIDNDGDLDLFIANLAHPRYIDISDLSQLLRNDGLTHRVVGTDTLYYWLFTDITKQSGITFDELHAEPLFFDADNDGFLDIYITSVYENDRSYLYHNNQDGTFSDITFLSGARVFNGWSCASGDLNRDGLIDLVIGSGNGTKILSNATQTDNRALYIKPVFKGKHIDLISVAENMPLHPNSPAFGARVVLRLQAKDGSHYSQIRELSSAKGSTTQNAPELHFGLGKNKILTYELWRAEP